MIMLSDGPHFIWIQKVEICLFKLTERNPDPILSILGTPVCL